MNRYMESKWSWIEGTHGMRMGLLETLDDADLGFSPGGHNVTLGELCRESGEIEYSYIQSLKTFAQSWNYRNEEPGLASSVAQLQAWYAALDTEMKEPWRPYRMRIWKRWWRDRTAGPCRWRYSWMSTSRPC